MCHFFRVARQPSCTSASLLEYSFEELAAVARAEQFEGFVGSGIGYNGLFADRHLKGSAGASCVRPASASLCRGDQLHGARLPFLAMT